MKSKKAPKITKNVKKSQKIAKNHEKSQKIAKNHQKMAKNGQNHEKGAENDPRVIIRQSNHKPPKRSIWWFIRTFLLTLTNK
jgi:hypothetical protein